MIYNVNFKIILILFALFLKFHVSGNNSHIHEVNRLLGPVPCTFTTSQDIGTTLLLKWTSFPNASSYNLQYRISGGSWISVFSNTNQMKLINLTPSSTYECRVHIYINGTYWDVTQTGSFSTGSTIYQQNFDMGSTIQISWNNYSTWATSYVIYYRLTGTTSWTTTSATNPVKLINILPNSTYDCKIATYINGIGWGMCQQGTFHTGDMNITSNQDMGTTASFLWTNYSWATSYSLQYKLINSSAWTGVPAYTNQIKITGLTPQSVYIFRVNVYKNGLYWGTSAEDTIVTNKIFFSNLNDNATSVEVGWSANIPISTWATSYILQYNLPQTTAWYSSPNSPTNSVTISPVIGGQDYLVRLRVYIGPTFWGTSQVEKIGRYSPVVLKHFTTEQLLPFPNPFNSQFQVNISTETESECHWDIFDLNGRKIKQGSYNLKPGDNSLNFDVTEIASGNYLLNLNIEGSTQIFKLIKN